MSERVGIQVNPGDNVVTVVEDALPGDSIRYATPDGSRHVTSLEQVPLGHKVALRDIDAEEAIIKYNQTIGTASKMIKQGEHVHVHNVRSAVQGAERED